MKTIKGNIEQLKVKTKKSKFEKENSFIHSFYLGETKVEITSKVSIDAQEGDFVIVAGEDGLNAIFKAYSFKNLT